MLRITDGKGFQITFANGWTVSVQFGPGNYCDHYIGKPGFVMRIGRDEAKCGKQGSTTAECAVLSPDGEMTKLRGWGDTVKGYCTPAEVLRILNWAARQKA